MWWIVILVVALVIPEIISTILDSRLGRAIANQIEARGTIEGTGPLTDRIRMLEGEVDRLSTDVQRLTDESEFFQKLLSERVADGRSTPRRGDSGP